MKPAMMAACSNSPSSASSPKAPCGGTRCGGRIARLTGYVRPVSDGTLYPAINRLARAGLLERNPEPGAGAGRYVLALTPAGRDEMLRRLRTPAEHEITDFTRFLVVLAFLSLLPDTAEQHAVLRRRLAFLEEPASFFAADDDGESGGGRPLRAEEVDDPYRRGMLLTARATSRAERAWLREVLGGATGEGRVEGPAD
ncbi:DNA-binding PadR family transcriptional regulator [Streptomyces sp. B3I8]|nr:PadR family transcriptional regulator [Streptomyces sp. B3I8]MDQ0786817.1 DNA-binding PadR family transcriptional regulator [Streptomyces sp. B3I8]